MGDILAAHFRLDVRRDDGQSLRAHLEAAERSTGRTPERLKVEPIPAWATWYVSAWSELASGRSYGAMGITPLTWVDIAAWRATMAVPTDHRDIRIIRYIDSVWTTVHAESTASTKPQKAASDAKR